MTKNPQLVQVLLRMFVTVGVISAYPISTCAGDCGCITIGWGV